MITYFFDMQKCRSEIFRVTAAQLHYISLTTTVSEPIYNDKRKFEVCSIHES